ncbi:MAG: type I-B CRISPR-associated protein Cas5b [Campylobacterota bacterium]|nr:type I-B CRISPR-associated protein Cas5b [Campylobacterota bacterium]
MKAISFEIGGKTAFFKKPDVNSYAYFTYNNIHKPALLGVLGAIIGLGGYTQLHNKNREIEQKNKLIKKKTEKLALDDGYPEFYEKLKDLKISIIPLSPNGYFSKKIQTFNNSVGYASFEQGGNLIIREQWLENPKWQIIILDNNSKEYGKIKEYLTNQKAIYTPYLGKNDHFADISEVKKIELKTALENLNLSSLFIEDKLVLSANKPRGESLYIFKEVSPIKLQKDYHFYEYETLCFTNSKVTDNNSKDIFSYDSKNYFFI